MKRVVLTGASGFVGANLARRLLRDGHEVNLLLRPGFQPWRIREIQKDVRLHLVHLHDAGAVEKILSEIRPNWIFHLAAHGAYSWQNDLSQMVQTNIIGTMNLVQASLHINFEAFVNTGSSSEYGLKNHPPAETEFLEPNSDYAVTKASATLFCRCTAQRARVHIPTLRLYSVYGPYEEPNRLVPQLILKGLSKQLPSLVDPEVARDFIHVDDVVAAYLAAVHRPGQEWGAVYNVGTGTQTSIQQAVEIARRAMDIAAEPRWGSMPPRTWDTRCWVADNRTICRALGWQPRLAFKDGFRLTYAWFQENPQLMAIYEGTK